MKQDPAATNLNYGGGHAGIPAPIAPLAHGAPLAYGGPIGHGAPLAYAGHGAPIVAHAPIASSYSVHTQHASIAAPLGHGAPLAYGHGAPLGHY